MKKIITEEEFDLILGSDDESHATHFSPFLKNIACHVFVKRPTRLLEKVLIMTDNEGWKIFKGSDDRNRRIIPMYHYQFTPLNKINVVFEVKKLIEELEYDHRYHAKKYLDSSMTKEDNHSFFEVHMKEFNKHILRLNKILNYFEGKKI